MKKKADLIVTDISELVTVSGNTPKTGKDLSDIGLIENGAFAVSDGKFVAVGKAEKILSEYESENVISAGENAVLPGFVDPHTHAVFGGDRSKEYEMRLSGATYEEIMEAGGGILSSVKMTREASEEELNTTAKKRLKNMISHGTTTVEIKSGYGLDTQTEKKMLKVAREVATELGINFKTTFLGAHSVPAGADRNEYIKLLKGEMLEACRQHSDYIDIFCDKGVFTNEETKEIVKDAGLPVRLHVDELADTSGAKLAAELGAHSADHLIAANDEGFEALAEAGTVATFLPGTSFYLGKPFARARSAIEKGCIVALATDRNPGSCTVESMQFVIGLACKFLKLTPKEAIVAATLNAAYSLRLHNITGSIDVGKQADFIVLDNPTYRIIPYEMTQNHVSNVFIAGKEMTWDK